MPIVIFSSIFLLVAYVPNIFGFHWPANIETILMKPYNYSMGILAVAVSATTANIYGQFESKYARKQSDQQFIYYGMHYHLFLNAEC